MLLINLNNELAVIEVSNEDSGKFLQGQLTNDIYELTNKEYQFTAYLNNKGRALAIFIAIKNAGNSYYLITPKEIIDKVIPRLKLFVLRSKVAINEVVMPITLTNYPSNGISLELVNGYFLNIGNKDASPTHNNTNLSLWKKLLVDNCIPFIYQATQELFIPQQINLDNLNGINFKKGCYVGQEIVARTHYLGKIKRRLAKITTDNQLAIGRKLFSPKFDNQEVGVVVDYTNLGNISYGLASIQIECYNAIYLDNQALQKVNVIT